MNNRCHIYLAVDARKVGEPALDDGEDIEVILRDLKGVRSSIRAGENDHSLVVAAFGLFVGLAHGWRRPNAKSLG
ncbi:MAG: hypothetical protein ACJAYU_004958 [Bradymonadia bacterium]|jgi:hypothetical protein